MESASRSQRALPADSAPIREALERSPEPARPPHLLRAAQNGVVTLSPHSEFTPALPNAATEQSSWYGTGLLVALWLADATLIVWIIATGGTVMQFGLVSVSVTGTNLPFLGLVLLGAGLEVTARGERSRLRPMLRSVRAQYAAGDRPRRFALILSMLVVLASLRAFSAVPDAMLDRLAVRGVTVGAPRPSGDDPRVLQFVDHLVRRPAQSTVVRIEGSDNRGHIQGFYAYPRVFKMEPGERYWSLRRRMLKDGGDPLFEPPKRPPLSESSTFAKERGAELLHATIRGIRVVVPASQP